MPQEPLEEVQSKIAYLERALAELGEVVFRQHREIQALQAKISAISDRVEATVSSDVRSVDSERPPHY
jgi:uncharacterized coiled-coil protein SlyX